MVNQGQQWYEPWSTMECTMVNHGMFHAMNHGQPWYVPWSPAVNHVQPLNVALYEP